MRPFARNPYRCPASWRHDAELSYSWTTSCGASNNGWPSSSWSDYRVHSVMGTVAFARTPHLAPTRVRNG